MPSLKIRRIDTSNPHAARQLAALKNPFADQANVVTPASRKLTQAVFGEAIPPAKAVEKICGEVQNKGINALLNYTEKFDKVRADAAQIRVQPEEMAAAFAATDPSFIDTARRIRDNVLQFQIGLMSKDALLPVSEHYELQLRHRPLHRVGICIPGGAAAYPSTLLMTVCPAQAAEVKDIVVIMPPTANGANNRDMLAICHMLGVKEVYRVGGAQGVAALAYGVEGLEPVDMIVGPGNLYVTLAKRFVFGQVAIDCLAGPSEVLVAADESAQPDFVALDMIAQAEHSPGVSLLVTWHGDLPDEVEKSLNKQLNHLDRGEQARACLHEYGAFVLVRDRAEGVKIVNQLAPRTLARTDARPRSIFGKGGQRRGDLPWAVHAGSAGRLCRRPVARASHGRHRPLRQRLERERFPPAHEHYQLHARRIEGNRGRCHFNGHSGGPDRPCGQCGGAGRRQAAATAAIQESRRGRGKTTQIVGLKWPGFDRTSSRWPAMCQASNRATASTSNSTPMRTPIRRRPAFSKRFVQQ